MANCLCGRSLDQYARSSEADVCTRLLSVSGITASVAEINSLASSGVTATLMAALVDGVLVFRTTFTPAVINTGTASICVPAVAAKRFQILSLQMRSNGGTVTGPTTVGIKEDGGAIFLSQAVAGLTSGVWHNTITGTPVITGMTSGGMTAVANKGLLAYCAGGDSTVAGAGVTGLSFIVSGYYTST